MSTVEREPSALLDLQTKYFNGIGEFDLLTAEQEVALAQSIELGREVWKAATEEKRPLSKIETELFTDGLSAKDTLITANLRLVVHVSRGFIQNNFRNVDKMDIYQLGNLGLERAAEKYDWRLENRFSTYATFWIQQTIRKGLNRAPQVPLPANVEAKLRLLAFYEDFYDDDTEITKESGWDSDLLEALRTHRFRNRYVVSLDEAVYSGDDDTTDLYDLLPDETTEEVEEYTDAADTLRKVLDIAHDNLSDEDYHAYVAILERNSHLKRHTNLAKELGRTTAQLVAIRARVYAILRHPSSGIAALRDPNLAWQRNASCWETPVDIFFPKRGEPVKLAEKFCGSCVVRDQCLNYALENSIKLGIWGHASERQSRPMRKLRGLDDKEPDLDDF